ncbi:hypothetical protein M1843_04015 [Isoptericola sp. 4D.3]|jgi:hypothetical protein|uniref:Serine/threonine protein kinase n=1 Tax=Isoptericola peretonis TaxID=2918523 RepID=A0ABT0J0A7_9MICO|nr:hypothetical protein [Isoptericola sp. 4D.3]
MTASAHHLSRGLVLAGAAAALALLVTACGASGDPSGDPSGGASSDVSPSASPSPSPVPPGGGAGDEAAAPPPGEHVRGLPEGAEGTFDSPAGAAWSPSSGVLLVVTYGSGSCPQLAEAEAGWDDAHDALAVGLVDPDPGPCTMDYTPTTSAVAVPSDADSGAPVTVRLGDLGTVEVAPRAEDGAAGPVAWVAAAG